MSPGSPPEAQADTAGTTDGSEVDSRHDESVRTVLIAGAANMCIAIAKVVGGVLTGSTSMLSEAAHSVADTLNQVFLLTALRRSTRPPDAQHPFGYGMERYFWSLLAAVGIFVLGAGFSILQGISAITSPEPVKHLPVAYVVLGLGLVFEGTSWVRAVKQLRDEQRRTRVSVLDQLRTSPDPTVKTVAFEDTAALVGLVLALIGVTLHQLTGQAVWDGLASIVIGLLLIVVAYALGAENKHLLIGRAVPDDVLTGIRETLSASHGIDSVVEILTMRLAPDEVLVAARVDLVDDASGADVEQYADEADRRVRESYPEVRHVFLDPTPRHE